MCGEVKKLDCLYEWEIHTSTKKSDKQSRCTWDCCRWVTAEIRKSTNRCILVQDVFLQHVRFGCELPLRWTWRAGWKSIQKSDPIFSTHLAKANLIADIPQRTEIFRKPKKKNSNPRGALGSNLKYHPLKTPGDSVIPGPPNSYNLWKPWSKAVKMATCAYQKSGWFVEKKGGTMKWWTKKSLPMSSHILNDKSWSYRSSQGWVRLNPEALFVAKSVDHWRVLQVLKDF